MRAVGSAGPSLDLTRSEDDEEEAGRREGMPWGLDGGLANQVARRKFSDGDKGSCDVHCVATHDQ